MTTPGDDARTEFRAFVRAHHPDRGGDPAVFVAGMATRGHPARREPAPTVVPGRSLSARLRRVRRRLRRVPPRTTPLR